MRPFNLEEARKGKPVCTRSGLPARILTFDRKGVDYQMISLIDNDGNELVGIHNLDGKCCHDNLHEYDLFMVTNKVEVDVIIGDRRNDDDSFLVFEQSEGKLPKDFKRGKLIWEE